jgi:pyridoxal phosphate-dependent aminotransferase EpsN
MPEAGFGRSTRWLTVLTVDPMLCGVSRDDIIDVLEAENIEARPVWKPMHLQPLYAGCRYYAHEANSPSPQPSPLEGEGEHKIFQFAGKGVFKGSVSDRLFELGLCLPSGSNLTLEEQARVINIIMKLIAKR